ncbi:MAG: RidA family protein [Hyphomicrobiaceae bacterium]|nr:RidA family protein [Hyphomicrobiaceae bacterium]
MSNGVTYYNPPKARELTSLYSHVARVKAGELAFIAGQIAPQGGNFEAQFKATMNQIGDILEDLGTDFNAVAKFTTYVVGAENVNMFRDVRDAVFPDLFEGPLYPPNTLLVVERLGDPAWLIEIEAVVRLPD